MIHPGKKVKNKAIKNEVCRNSEGRSKTWIEQGQQFLSLSGNCKVACSRSSWGWHGGDRRIVQVWGVNELELRSQLYYLQAVWLYASDVAFPCFSSSSIIHKQWYHRFGITIKWDKVCRGCLIALANAGSPPHIPSFFAHLPPWYVTNQMPGTREGYCVVVRQIPTIHLGTQFSSP